MVKVKQMGSGILDDTKAVVKRLGKEAVDIALPIAKEYAKEVITKAVKKKMGDGLYAANVGRGFRMTMSPAQVRNLKRGGAVQLNRDMLDEAGRFAMELKPEIMDSLEKALSKSKGLRVSRDHLMDLIDTKKGGSVLSEAVKIVAPIVAQKMMEMGLAKAGGDILEEKFSINDVGRTAKRLFGMGKHGMPIADQQFSIDASKSAKKFLGGKYSKKQLNQIILDKNKVISDLEETAYSKGKGLFAGGGIETGVIQTGSPYKNPLGQQMNPFKEVSNPYY